MGGRIIGPRVLWLIGLLAWGCAGTPPPEPATAEDILYREVFQIPGVSKNDLFERAKSWVNQTFSNSLDVIQYSNRPQGMIVAKSYLSHERPGKLGTTEYYDFRFTVIIETKDGKIRVTFSDMALVSRHGHEVILKSDMDVIRPKLQAALRILTDSFQAPPENDDW